MEHRSLHSQLASIRDHVIAMGSEVEAMVATATRALVERDEEQVEHVLARDRVVDRMEVDIDEACHSLLARNQPTAVDMRFLVAVMKITADLERMGDSAVNIVQAAHELNREAPLPLAREVAPMSQCAQAMVRESLDALVRKDAAQAARVCKADDEVDEQYRALFARLLTLMTGEPQAAPRAVHLLLVARNLERIADHATNIAEDVIYYVEGRDIRHSLSSPHH